MRAIELAVAVVLATTSVALGGCTTEDGSTPTCVQDVDQSGNKHLATGCNQFAVCADDSTGESCCKDLKGKDHCLCLYGYGQNVDCSGGGTGGSGGAVGTGGRGGTGGAAGSGGAGGGP